MHFFRPIPLWSIHVSEKENTNLFRRNERKVEEEAENSCIKSPYVVYASCAKNLNLEGDLLLDKINF